MRRLAAILPALALAALALPGPVAAGTATFSITKEGFYPNSVTIETGDTVLWRNDDTHRHAVVFDGGRPRTPVLEPGETYSRTFAATGSFGFHDGFVGLFTGGVVVVPGPPRVTIAASRGVALFRQPVTLSGQISAPRAGEPIEVEIRVVGQRSFVPLTTAETAAGGFWRAVVTMPGPGILRARWRGLATSEAVEMRIRPAATLLEQTGSLTAEVETASPITGRRLIVQRRSPSGRWQTIAAYLLDHGAVRFFNPPLPPGVSVLRVYLPHERAGPGYVDAVSRPLRVTR